MLKEKGFLAVYEESTENGDEKNTKDATLPELNDGEALRLLGLDPIQHFTEPPPRYTEASLVKALEENGIGRPSTYAAILSTIEKREYTVKEERKFQPTELGLLVAELLEKNFPDIDEMRSVTDELENLSVDSDDTSKG